MYCFNHYQRCIKQFFDGAKQSQQKHFAAANELLEPLPCYVNQRMFESKASYMSNNRETVANNNEKLMQLIEKCSGEKLLWARCYHLQYFTAGIDVCARNEFIKAHLYKLLMNRNTRIDEIVRTMVRSDTL